MSEQKPRHPGHVIRDEYLQTKNLDISSLAEQLDISEDSVNNVLEGEVDIDHYLSEKLDKVFETSDKFWIRLQRQYDDEIFEYEKMMDKEVDKEFPIPRTVDEKKAQINRHTYQKEKHKKNKGKFITIRTRNIRCTQCGAAFWTEDEALICPPCKIGNILGKIHNGGHFLDGKLYPGLKSFEQVALLDIEFLDYSRPTLVKGLGFTGCGIDNIITSYTLCSLVKIEKHHRKYLKELYNNTIFGDLNPTDKNKENIENQKDEERDYVENAKYIFGYIPYNFAKRQNRDGIGGVLLGRRFACYLHNKFARTLNGTNPLLDSFKTNVGFWIGFGKRLPVGKETLKMTVSDFIEPLFKITPYPPQISDFDVEFIIEKLVESEKSGCIFRGINECFFFEDGISSSNYRNNRDIAKHGLLLEHEKTNAEKLLNAPNHIYSSNDITCALTDMRHSGKDTNLLDFSRNHKVSLFFSCHGSNKKHNTSEYFILKDNTLEKKFTASYEIRKDYILQPKSINELVNENRINAQQGEFIHCNDGFLSREKYSKNMENILIDASLKKFFLDYCGFAEIDIYPDYQGYMDNPNNWESDFKRYAKACDLFELVEISIQSEKIGKAKEAMRELEFCLDKSQPDWDRIPDIKNKIETCKKIINTPLEIGNGGREQRKFLENKKKIT